MPRNLRLARFEDAHSAESGSAPGASDVRELAHRLYEQRAERTLRPAQPQPALDWFLSLVFRPDAEATETEQSRIRRAA